MDTSRLISVVFLIANILLWNNLSAQKNHEDYFSIANEDKARWITYSEFIQNSTLDLLTKADSIYQFALIEYDLRQYSKTRELCEIANAFNPSLTKTHILIGKSYVSSSELCASPKNIKGETIWVAIDEWEKALEKQPRNKEAITLINRYGNYLLTKEEFRTCWTGPTLKEGDKYLVECWVQRETRVRFKEMD